MVSRQLKYTIQWRCCQVQNYSIGLDIGTSSVGWAVIDNDTNKVIKRKKTYYTENGKEKKQTISLWGSRLFDEATPAADRRTKRSQRRRYARRRARIKLLRSLFQEEINKVDNNFFNKLDESFYKENDLENKKHKLSEADKKFIKNYQKKYKTIYHLRKELIDSKERQDIRLIYLAIHHIIKYRGNFNYPGKAENFKVEEIETRDLLQQILEEYKDNLEELDLSYDYYDDKFINEINDTFKIQIKSDRNKKIKDILGRTNTDKTFTGAFASALSGYNFDASKLLALDTNDKLTIKFSDANFDENIEKNSSILGEKVELLLDLKDLYDKVQLKNIFGEYNAKSISDLKLKMYKTHGTNLNKLKKIFKSNIASFNKLFNSSECSYYKYVTNKIDYSEFKKDLDKESIKLTDSFHEKYNNLNNELENDEFLPRITSTDNGQYPYQLNEVELIEIIENQMKYYPFLGDKQNGTYKIAKLLEFKIPYYVGPLNNTTCTKNIKNKNSWLIRNENYENTTINPFNFDEIVNKDATAEEFIKRMISHDTYLLEEEALPNNSILYSEYKVLNELKQISYSDNTHTNKLSAAEIHKIYKELFLKNKNVTKRTFENYIRSNKNISGDIDYKIEGYSSDKGFANNMTSYIDFFGSDGILVNTKYDNNDAEKIIEWITIFEDKDILKSKVQKAYPELTEESIKKITKLKYSGWGRLSRKLLSGILSDEDSHYPKKTIIEIMRESNENFMQILNNKEYKFLDTINNLNSSDMSDDLDYSLVENLATSPANKRGIWQALKIVREIVDYLGKERLDSIYLEMSRGEGQKVRSTRRKDILKKFINNNTDIFENYKELTNELESFNDKDITERVYLYFMQGGKSLYSRTPIFIEDIFNKDKYEVDHIIPRSLIKDDSLDNKALVLRKENQIKGGAFVLPKDFRTGSNYVWWQQLRDRKLISEKKFRSLTRSEMDDKTISGFINRQIVETRQISIHVANILKKTYGENKNISFINANLSHNYREATELFKYRDLNDYHHAKDAYLAVVLGKYKDKMIDKNDVKNSKIIKKLKEQNIDYNKMKYGMLINSLIEKEQSKNYKTGEVIDNKELNNIIKYQMYNNDVLVTKKTEIRTGTLFDETKYSVKDVKGSIKIKNNLSLDYGGYSSLKPSYICLVKYTKKSKEEQKLVGIPIMYANSSENTQINYLKSLLKIDEKANLEILKSNIPFYSILNWNGQICSIVGATDKIEVCNAIEFKFDSKSEEKWKYSLNRLFNNKINSINDEDYDNELSDIINYVYKKIENVYKLYNNLLNELKVNMCLDDLNKIDISTKENILREIFKLLKFNSVNANFKFLDNIYPDKKHSSAFGKKNDRIVNHATIINNSVTGIKTSYYEF